MLNGTYMGGGNVNEYGVLECDSCEHHWPDELPDLLTGKLPACPCCESSDTKLHTKLVPLERPPRFRDETRRRRDRARKLGAGAGAILASNGYLMAYLFHMVP